MCGAPNVPPPGGRVALAPIGTKLPAIGVTLEPREIGGIRSEGMLCSEMELGLVSAGGPDPGILVLPSDAGVPGTPLREAVPGVHDWILDIGLTPNRPDGLGHVGLAREAAALFALPFSPPAPSAPARVATGAGDVHRLVTVEIQDEERCPRYGAAAVVDVTIGPSPAWLRYRLESLGVRAISNVVDVTNLAMLELAQPMHAFDLDRVRGGRIVVRRARSGEVLETLDGQKRTLDPDDLVIADGEGPVALAGVMGGANSEIGPGTRRVLLECAYFEPRGVRRTSRRHGLHTESSHRFERGTDPAGVPDVLAHAASLLTTLAGGAAVPGAILAGPGAPARPTIRLRSARIDALLGTQVPFTEALTILERLGCDVRAAPAHGEADVVPPTHRPDLSMEADLIEEVLRVRGIDTVPMVLPAIKPQAPRATGVFERRVRRAAIELGLSEAITYGFVSPKDLAALGLPEAPVTLQNPLSEDRSVMRTSLLPGLLETLRRARRRGVREVRLFTVGPRFLGDAPANGRSEEDRRLPDEVPSFAAVLAGPRRERLAKPAEVDVYDAKGVAVEIVERVTHRAATVRLQGAEARAPYLHPRGAADVVVTSEAAGAVVVGTFGPLHPDVVDALDLEGPCVIVEIDVRALERVGTVVPKFRPIPVLPAATRDISLVVHEDVTAGAVADAIRETAGELCESVELFDLFRGAGVPADHRSLAYHVVYRDPKASTDPERARTLTDEEVDQRHQAVIKTLNERFGAVLRG